MLIADENADRNELFLAGKPQYREGDSMFLGQRWQISTTLEYLLYDRGREIILGESLLSVM